MKLSNLIFLSVVLFIFNVGNAVAQVIPEYESSRAIVYSFGSLPWQVFYVPKEALNNLIDERFNLYQTALSANPRAEHIFLLNSIFKNDPKSMYSPYFDKKIRDFIAKNPTAKILESRFELNETPDEWTRDYIPVAVRDQDKIVKLYNTDYRSPKAGVLLSSALQLEIIGDSPSRLPGGNIMADDQGNCYMTDNETTSPLTKYCKKVVTLTKLNLEKTNHVDLFAKLLDSRTAIVSSYSSDEVEIIQNPFYLDAICSDEEIAARKFYSCPFTMTADNQNYGIIRENSKSKTILLSEIKSFVMQKYPEIEVTSDLPVTVNWKTHFESVASTLRSNGFEIVKIEAPKPLLRVQITRFKDQRGKLLKQNIEMDIVFRSYTNSLVTNGMAVVPTYPLTDSSELDASALNIYKKIIGANVYAAPSDYSILGGGAVHCLTHEIPN